MTGIASTSGRQQPIRPADRSVPRQASSSTLSRAASALALTPAMRLPTTQPARPSPRVLIGGTTRVPLPASRVAGTNNTVTLRQPSSQLSLRPARRIQPSSSNLRPHPEAPALGGRTVRRVPSTSFKENFFAPPPPIPEPSHQRAERKGLAKKQSQLLPMRRAATAAVTPGRGVLVSALPVSGALQQPLSTAGSIRLPERNPKGPAISKRAPTPSHLPPSLTSGPIVRCTPHSRSASHLHPSPSPSSLGSSPWKGPSTNVDQIKDTEFSFAESDSLELPCAAASRLDPGGASEAGQWLSVSTLRPSSRAPARVSVPPDWAMTALREKERQIEMLEKELSLEREMLGRMRRDAEDRDAERREQRQEEKGKMARMLARGGLERAADKCQAVVNAAGAMQKDVDAAKEVIRRLRETLDRPDV